jgi:hypothetical protein
LIQTLLSAGRSFEFVVAVLAGAAAAVVFGPAHRGGIEPYRSCSIGAMGMSWMSWNVGSTIFMQHRIKRI